MANVLFGPNDTLIAAVSKGVYLLDLKTDKIIVDNCIIKSAQSDNDEINQISLDYAMKNLAACDDQQSKYIEIIYLYVSPFYFNNLEEM